MFQHVFMAAIYSKETNGISSAEAMEEWLQWPGEPFGWLECDSPIENDFFHEIHKFTGDQTDLKTQYEFSTSLGLYRVDFLLTHRTTGRAIVVECDGKKFHFVGRDSQRDKAIIQTGRVAAIYRIAGKDLHYCSLDVLQLIAQREPWLVSDRFLEQAEFYPHPSLYSDDEIGQLERGYKGLMRTYFECVEKDEDYYVECGCEGDCDCRYKPKVEMSDVRTPTIIRYMTGYGHPSAFERPASLVPLSMPKWKREMAKIYHQTVKKQKG